MLKKVFFIIVLFFSINSFAQKEANNWYFGWYAGIDFNSGTPVPLTDGQLRTREGCSTISDRNGNLLFYSDGRKVWDRSHQVMPNGGHLLGSDSSTQSAIIVPNPSNRKIYYIITVEESGLANGLRYSKIDMTLNGGMGAVVEEELNVPLVSPVSEKVTAVKSDDGSAIFLFTYRDGVFYTFEITHEGVNTTPIQTTSGLFMEHTEGRGYLKASPDGNKLAIVHEHNKKVFLYDLNKVTGKVSNEKEMFLDDPSHANNNTNTLPYGIEFSPNSKLLYVTSAIEDNTTDPSLNKSYLWQFDLEDAAPENTSLLIHYQEGNCRGAVQLAPDLKIYHALSITYSQGMDKLSVINHPNLRGNSCDYTYASFDLNGKKSMQGLPPFIQSFFNVFMNGDDTCLGYPTEFSLIDYSGIFSYTWDFGDGHTVVGNLPPPNPPAPIFHTYESPGLYTVKVTADTSAGTKVHVKVIEVLEPIADDLPDVTVCDKYKLPELSSYIVNYYTESGGNGKMLFANDLIEETQTIYIYAETGTEPNCTDERSFTVTIEESPELPVFEDVVAKNEYKLPELEMGNYFTAPDGGGSMLHAGDLIKENQTIYVYVETGIEPYKCTDEKQFQVTIEIEIKFMPFFTPNGDGINDRWMFKNDQVTADTLVFIYDRFGKLVAKINPAIGWDGNFQGIQLPTSEYWFSFVLPNGKIVTGNFSLIRK